MIVLDDIGRLLIFIWMAAGGTISNSDVGAAVSAFGFFSGFLSYILATIASRKAYVRIERNVTIVIAVQGFAIFLGIMDLVTQASFLGWNNFLFKTSLIIWAISLFAMYWLLDQVICIDRIKFKKPKIINAFSQFQNVRTKHVQQFGVDCVDHFLKLATEKREKLFFPILLVAEKHFRPWRICLRFAAAGLMCDERVIYFSFNQPANTVVTQLAQHLAFLEGANLEDWRSWWEKKEHEASKRKFENLYVIDCCSSWVGRSNRSHEDELETELINLVRARKNVFGADPRDPIELGSNYDKTLRKVIRDANRKQVFLRVVYDSVSDLLEYGDPQSTMQLIKHNMVWEEQNGANSLYLFIPAVPQPNLPNPVDIEFLRWNAYCEIDFEYPKTGGERMFIDSLFLERKGAPIMMQVSNNDYVRKTMATLEKRNFSPIE